MIVEVVCVFVVQGLLVKGFPTEQCESKNGDTFGVDLGSTMPVAVDGIVECSETVPSSEHVTLLGTYGNLQESISEPTAIFSENNSNKSIDLRETIINTLLLVDTILAEEEEKINQKLAALDKEVDLKLENVDKKLTELSLKNSDFTKPIDSAIPDLMKLGTNMASELLIIKDSIESECEVTRKQVRSILESKYVAEPKPDATKLTNEIVVVELEKEIAPNNMTKKESLVKLEPENYDCNPTTLKIESETLPEEEIKSKLFTINSIIESELAKIDSFVESELKFTEALIQAEVDKVNSFVDARFKTADLIEPMTDLESIEESELAIEVPVEGVTEFSGVVPASGRTLIFGSTGYSPILPVLGEYGEGTLTEEVVQRSEVPVVDEEVFTGTVPVYGRTLIFGSTGFLHPNLAQQQLPAKKTAVAECPTTIPISIESTPVVFGNSEYTPIYDEIEDTSNPEAYLMPDEVSLAEPIIFENNDSETFPVIGNAVFSGVAPAVGSVKILGSFGCDPLFSSNPPVADNAKPFIESKAPQEYNSNKNNLCFEEDIALNIPDIDDSPTRIDELPTDIVAEEKEHEKTIEEAVAEGHIEFSGTARSTGRTRLVAEFGCHPLLPTAETPDGKKYLWIAKRPTINASPPVPRKPEPTNKPNFPRNFPMLSKFSPEFPETVIMDSTKNYERLIEDYEVLSDPEIDHFEDAPVVGEVFFEGKAPAFGSVSITGHCV